MSKGTVNKVILIGRMGKDPEIRETASGLTVANVSLATTSKHKEEERTEWHRVTFFGKLAEIVGSYLQKGSLIYVEGRLETRKWTTEDGTDKYSTDIIAQEMNMLSSNSNDKKQNQDDDGIPF